MISRDTAERVERLILECGQLGVKPTPEAIAEMLVEQDADSTGAAPQDPRGAYGEYREAVTRILIGRKP